MEEENKETGKKRALIIGVNKYDDAAFTPLEYAAKDAKDVEEILANTDIGGFDEVVLRNEPENTTKSEVELQLARLFNKTKEDDFLLVYFAGHGKLDKAGKLCLATRDTKADTLRVTSIPLDTIPGLIEDSNCQSTVLIIDSCYSGASGVSFRSADVLTESFTRFSAPTPGKIIISASQALESARESDDLKHGIFTHFLIEGLKKEADSDGDGYVSLEELYNYVRQKVEAKTNRKQSPSKWGNGKSDIIIAQHKETLEKRISEIEQAELESKRARLFDFYEQEKLPFRIYNRTLVVVRPPQASLNPVEKRYREAIEALIVGDMIPEDFIENWNRIEKREQAERPKDRPGQDHPPRPSPVSVEATPTKPADSAKKEQIEQDNPRIVAVEGVSHEGSRIVEEDKGRVVTEERLQVVRDQVFVSYSHEDKKWLKQLEPKLKGLERRGIKVFVDNRIEWGDEWRSRIKEGLDRAKVAVLLVTDAFLTSEYIQETELPSLLEAAKKDGATILWILLREALYRGSGIEGFQAAQEDFMALERMSEADQNTALTRLCEKIIKIMRPEAKAAEPLKRM